MLFGTIDGVSETLMGVRDTKLKLLNYETCKFRLIWKCNGLLRATR